MRTPRWTNIRLTGYAILPVGLVEKTRRERVRVSYSRWPMVVTNFGRRFLRAYVIHGFRPHTSSCKKKVHQ